MVVGGSRCFPGCFVYFEGRCVDPCVFGTISFGLCFFADHVYHHFRKFKNCVLMFSRLSREFGGPFFCVWVLILFFGILFILWAL